MQATWYRSVSKWGECLSFCQSAIKIMQMRNSRTVSDSVCLGPEAAGSWVTQGNATQGQAGTQRDTQALGSGVGTGSLALSGTQRLAEENRWEKRTLTWDQIWRFDSRWEQFPSSEKKRQKKCPSVTVLYLLEKSLLFPWETSLCGSCLNKEVGTKQIMWWNWPPVKKNSQSLYFKNKFDTIFYGIQS